MSSVAKPVMLVLLSLALAIGCLVPALAYANDYLIEYEGKARGLVSVDEEIFEGFAEAMPGDVFKGTVTIRNDDASVQDFYFYVKPSDQANREEGDEMLDLTGLTISSEEGDVYYDGPLRASSLETPVLLGTFGRGEGVTLEFTVMVPWELGNEFALAKNEVVWVFGASEVAEEGGTDAKGFYDKTGDSPMKLVAMCALGLVVLTCVIILIYRNAGKRESEERQDG